MLIILLVVLLVLSLGSLPSWPYSRGWGYYPSGGTRCGGARGSPATGKNLTRDSLEVCVAGTT